LATVARAATAEATTTAMARYRRRRSHPVSYLVCSGRTVAAFHSKKAFVAHDDGCRSLDVIDKILLGATLRLLGSKLNKRELSPTRSIVWAEGKSKKKQ
jgi:hypothetical protein